jgi:hypothetical protein
MSKGPKNGKSSRFWKPPLLKSESAAEFEAFQREIENELKPQGLIKQRLIREYVYLEWDIQRLRLCKSSMIEAGSRPALQHLLEQVVGEDSGSFDDIADRTKDVSVLYFRNEKIKPTVLQILAQFGLDESAIVAQAMRDALPSLELIEKMLASQERRRTRLLLLIARYDESLAQRTRENADRMSERGDLPEVSESDLKITP